MICYFQSGFSLLSACFDEFFAYHQASISRNKVIKTHTLENKLHQVLSLLVLWLKCPFLFFADTHHVQSLVCETPFPKKQFVIVVNVFKRSLRLWSKDLIIDFSGCSSKSQVSASVLLELDALFGSLKVVDLTGLPKIQMNGRENSEEPP